MDGNIVSPSGFILIPTYIMGILYVIGAWFLFQIRAMPIRMRLSMVIPIFIIGIVYLMVYFYNLSGTQDGAAIVRLANFVFIFCSIVNSGVYMYGKRKGAIL